LLRANPIAVGVIVAVVAVVAAVVAIGSRRSCGSDGGGTDGGGAVAPAWAIISASRVTGDRTPRPTSYRVTWSGTPGHVTTTALDAPGVNGAAADASTTVKSSGAHAAAATRISIIWNEGSGEKNERRKSSENITKHGVSSIA
jgi:hypothetical protein